MTRTIAALLVAATIAGVAAPAAAQTRYYARERIVGLAKQTSAQDQDQTPTTYVPTYSTSFSTCAAGEQSAPIASCATSDGKPATLTSCSGFPQSTTRKCTAQFTTCTGMAVDRGPVSGGGPVVVSTTAITSASAAQEACNAYLTKNAITTSGVCYHVMGQTTNLYNGKAVWFPGTTLKTPYGNGTDYFAAFCSK